MSTHTLAAPSLPSYGADLRQEIESSFAGPIRPAAVPPLYRLGLLVVAVAMVLLPLIYVGLILATGYGVWYHATANLTIFKTVDSAMAALVAYAGPLVIGVILIFFLIKPLFARAARPAAPRSLRRDEEPVLFDYVEQVCRSVGAPFPKRIDVDCQVNASASFRRGWLSFFGQDLVLTLGLPLVAGFSLRQLTGVLAHEFGHFAQGAGMRLTYVIRSVNHWFMRVVHERDSWDERLEAAARESNHLAISIVIWAAKLMVGLTRAILRLLMGAGHVLSCFLLRQMEYDADRYEARMVGSEIFESTCRELSNLSVAYQKSMADLGSSWQEGRLVDSLPGLVHVNRHRFEPQLLSKIQAHVEESSTGLFDTHPADSDRIASARREGVDGVFRSTLPATAIFRDFHAVATDVSLDFYRGVLGDAVKAEDLHEVGDIAARQEQLAAEAAARRTFFQGVEHVLRPLPIPAALPEASGNTEAVLERLAEIRRGLEERGAAYRRDVQRFEKADSRYTAMVMAEGLHEVGIRFSPEDFDLTEGDLSSVVAEKERSERQRSELDGGLAEVEALAVRRLSTALELASSPASGEDAEAPAADAAEVAKLLAAAAAIAGQRSRIDNLREDYVNLGMFGGLIEDHADSEPLASKLSELADKLHGHLSALAEDWAEVPYPFDHADASTTLGSFVVPSRPDANDLGGLYALTQTALQSTDELYFRLLGRLSHVAEGLEARFGLERLPDFADDEASDES